MKTRWETLAAGENAEGGIRAELSEEMSGTVQIAGRLVWQTA
ncbi:hypothetical protein [Streptomyces sp. ISL-66]|nr:hypothetical protein [Streptomyces sp. ISL-66]